MAGTVLCLHTSYESLDQDARLTGGGENVGMGLLKAGTGHSSSDAVGGRGLCAATPAVPRLPDWR